MAPDFVCRMAEASTPVHLPPNGIYTVGRSHKADFKIEGNGVSNTHLTISSGPTPQMVSVTDTSQNGVGVVPPGGRADEAATLQKGITTSVPLDAGLLIPMRLPGGSASMRDAAVLWILRPADLPIATQVDREMQPPRPLLRQPPRPPTWPSKWMSLANSIQDLWEKEGICTPMDLDASYTSEADLRAELAGVGATEPESALAIAFWRSAARDARMPAGSWQIPEAPHRRREPPDAPVTKRRKGPPKQLHEPGLWHQQWQAKDALRTARATRAQGLLPATREHLEEVWKIYLQARPYSSLYRKEAMADEDTLRELLTRPFRRYADSLGGRLAAWRRWEAWTRTQQPNEDNNPFRPTGFFMGKYLLHVDQGGATAAAQAWAGLKWWAERLGLDMALQTPLTADFRLKVPGHTTRQAEVLSLDTISALRHLATGTGTRSTFASIILLIAGACVRFLHIQRSMLVEITDELVICRCAKGKRRQQGIREAYRWASPRAWGPESDTAARAVTLIRDVATKAKGYADSPFLIPDLSTTQCHSIDPGDVWLPRPMSYKRFVTLMRTLLSDLGSPGPASGWTFNALRRLMPTGADVLQFSDNVATAIGNWQETPRGNSDVKRGRMQDQMTKRYAGEKVVTAGHYKILVVAAIWHAEQRDSPEGQREWSNVRLSCPNKKTLHQLAKQFMVKGDVGKDTSSPGCLPHLPRGQLRHIRAEPQRCVPALDEVAWFMQSLATASQRPWVHFAPGANETPYCRLNKFRRDPVLQGQGLVQAASTGERPCPRCVARMGDKASAVIAEFCTTDKEQDNER